MAYIGKQPLVGNFTLLDSITATTTDTYALTKDSVAVFPQTPANCIVSLNGVIQAPTDSYTISGSDIVFASALTGSDSIDFITVLGDVLNVGTVSDGTIGLAKLSATGTKDATTFLRGDNTFQEVPAGGITMADQFRLTSAYTWSSPGDLTANLERVDGTNQGTLGTGMSESSGIFTFPSTGYYLVRFSAQQYKNGDRRDIEINIKTTANNSSYAVVANCKTHITQSASSTTYIQGMTETLLDITDTSNQKVKFNVFTDATTAGDTALNQTFMTFLRIGDT
jgi:hypothetical protein